MKERLAFTVSDDEGKSWRPVGWQPIETAPKDGLILLAVKSGSERRVFVAQADYPPTGFRWITTHGLWWDGLHGDWEPTHWQPLPEPPA